jgi:hypothetical protein
MYQAAIGEYAFAADFNSDESKLNSAMAWVIFILMTFIVQVIMMNLIIGIVGKSYEKVYNDVEPWIYMTRSDMTNKLKYLLSKKDKEEVFKQGPYLMIVHEIDLEEEEEKARQK